MTRWGLGIAAVTLATLSACSGSSSAGGSSSTPASSVVTETPKRLSLADGCPLVYQATSDNNGRDTVTEEVANHTKLSEQLADLADQSDIEGANAIRAYGDAIEARIAALNSQSATPAEQAQSLADEWSVFGDYGKLCQAAGADLS